MDGLVVNGVEAPLADSRAERWVCSECGCKGAAMLSKSLGVILAASLLTSCAHGYKIAPPSLSDWATVVGIPLETPVEALTTSGRTFTGRLRAVDATHLELDPLSIRLERIDVTAVWLLGRPDRLRNGALVGGAIGLIVGLAAGQEGPAGLLVPAGSAVIGGAVGAWIDRGWNGPRRTLVFQRP